MTRDEAIKTIMSATVWTDEEREALATLIPELRESEDERIMKTIRQLLETARDAHSNTSLAQPYIDALAWLEKQKEHQEICTKFLAKILKHSAEGFRNVLKKKGIDYIPPESFWTGTAGTFSKQECNEFYKWMDDMTMELVTEETPEYKKGFKAGRDFEKQKEQKHYWKPTETDVALFNKAVTTNKALTPAERAQLDIIRSKFGCCRAVNCNGIVQKEQKPVNHNLTTWHRDVVYCAMCDKNLDEGLRCNLEVVYKTIKEIVDRTPIVEEQKDYNKLYEDIGKSEWFKKAYEGKSLGCDYEQKEQKPKAKAKSPLSPHELYDAKIEGISQGRQDVLDHPEQFGLQKPAEWSEEDEKMLDSIIKVVCGVGVQPNGLREKQVRFLKSLRPQYHGDVTMTEAYKMGLEAGKASSWKSSEEQTNNVIIELTRIELGDIINGLYYLKEKYYEDCKEHNGTATIGLSDEFKFYFKRFNEALDLYARLHKLEKEKYGTTTDGYYYE